MRIVKVMWGDVALLLAMIVVVVVGASTMSMPPVWVTADPVACPIEGICDNGTVVCRIASTGAPFYIVTPSGCPVLAMGKFSQP